DRPATVARIDRGIRLHRQKRSVATVHVGLQIDARDHPARVGYLFAAGGIAVSDNRGTHLRQVTKSERLQAIEKTLILDFKQSEVAVVRDEFDAREIRPRILVAPHNDLLPPA